MGLLQAILDVFPWLGNGTMVAIQFLNGLSVAMFLAIVAVGLSLIFGVARVLNLAHGSFFMLGAYFMVAISDYSPTHGWFWCSAVLSGVAVGLISFFVERVLLRRIYKRGQHLQLIMTFGLTLVIGSIVLLTSGSEFKKMNRPEALAGTIPLLEASYPIYNIVVIGLVPVILVSLWALISFTRWGRNVRAASVDRAMLEALGVDSNVLLTQVFVFSSVLAGVAGALAAPTISVDLNMGTEVLLNSSVVVIIGGLGSIVGGLFGALIVGQLQCFGVLIFPQISSVIMYVVMLVVLIVRPWGLMGRSEGRVEDEGVGV